MEKKFHTCRPNFVLASVGTHCLFVTVKINDVDFDMLVDTGSAVTLLSPKIYKCLGSGGKELSTVDTVLTTADGDVMDVMGQTDIRLNING